ncbi:MAG TPA: hypothetical protein VKY85_07200 [Candidatus Angelobacter sp.]|nr:hypothetical protein [Candidatus Angelobacter sp.]
MAISQPDPKSKTFLALLAQARTCPGGPAAVDRVDAMDVVAQAKCIGPSLRSRMTGIGVVGGCPAGSLFVASSAVNRLG